MTVQALDTFIPVWKFALQTIFLLLHVRRSFQPALFPSDAALSLSAFFAEGHAALFYPEQIGSISHAQSAGSTVEALRERAWLGIKWLVCLCLRNCLTWNKEAEIMMAEKGEGRRRKEEKEEGMKGREWENGIQFPVTLQTWILCA